MSKKNRYLVGLWIVNMAIFTIASGLGWLAMGALFVLVIIGEVLTGLFFKAED